MANSIHNTFIERFGVTKGWKAKRLCELAKFAGGGTPDSTVSAYWDGDIPWLTPTEMTEIEGRFAYTSERQITVAGMASARCSRLEPGTLVMSTRGTVGNVVIAGVPLTCNQSCEALLPVDGVDSDYLYFLLSYWRPLIERYGAGTTFKSITRRDIRHVCFSVPDSDEQKRISRVLVGVEDVVSAVRDQLAAAYRLKTALMQQLFTKGIPGRHKKFVEMKRGLRPASWNVFPLARLADVDAGVTLNQDRAARSNGYRYLTVVNVQRDSIDLSEIRTLELWPSEVPVKLLREKDILVVEGHANGAEIGRAAMVDADSAGMTFQNHLFRVRVTADDLQPEFLLHMLNSERIRRHWNAVCNTSSGLNTINRRMLRRVEVLLPDPDEQKDILALILNAKQTISACESKMTALLRLKKSLLQNMLTGKVRVMPESRRR